MNGIKKTAANFWDAAFDAPGEVANWFHIVDQGDFWSLVGIGIVVLAFVIGRAMK